MSCSGLFAVGVQALDDNILLCVVGAVTDDAGGRENVAFRTTGTAREIVTVCRRLHKHLFHLGITLVDAQVQLPTGVLPYAHLAAIGVEPSREVAKGAHDILAQIADHFAASRLVLLASG